MPASSTPLRCCNDLVNLVAATAIAYVGPEPSLLAAQWSLRYNVSAYDAAVCRPLGLRYVLPLVTLDLRLVRAAQLRSVSRFALVRRN